MPIDGYDDAFRKKTPEKSKILNNLEEKMNALYSKKRRKHEPRPDKAEEALESLAASLGMPVEDIGRSVAFEPVDYTRTKEYALQKRIDELCSELDEPGAERPLVIISCTNDGILAGNSRNITKHDGEIISAVFADYLNKFSKEKIDEETGGILYCLTDSTLIERYDLDKLKKYACLTRPLKDSKEMYLIVLFDAGFSIADIGKVLDSVDRYV